MREAVGTSLLVIAINSGAGFLGHFGAEALNLELVVPFTIAAVVGGAIGERVACSLSLAKLRRGFALFVITVGVAVAFVAIKGAALASSSPRADSRFASSAGDPRAPRHVGTP
jgi:uncharacterized membrane protein YfcA